MFRSQISFKSMEKFRNRPSEDSNTMRSDEESYREVYSKEDSSRKDSYKEDSSKVIEKKSSEDSYIKSHMSKCILTVTQLIITFILMYKLGKNDFSGIDNVLRFEFVVLLVWAAIGLLYYFAFKPMNEWLRSQKPSYSFEAAYTFLKWISVITISIIVLFIALVIIS